MLIDSHCHLNAIDLSQFDNQLANLIQAARAADVGHFLSVCVVLEEFPELCRIADQFSEISISVGLHPTHKVTQEPSADDLIKLSLSHPACIAIGETGLDYYHDSDTNSQLNQRNRFREHIRAAIQTQKPLIIHTRQAAEDTLLVMEEERAYQVGGVMHCFSENLEIAKRAMAMNFYISMSGVVTFKNATALQQVAKEIPLDKMLIETDSPYLAPVPFRGKQNHPALVKHVALALSVLRGCDYETIAIETSKNFKKCFKINPVSSS